VVPRQLQSEDRYGHDNNDASNHSQRVARCQANLLVGAPARKSERWRIV
jgi:hypothetical protein